MSRLHSAASPESLIGEVFADRYRILEIIGEGGVGVVFKARHTLIDRLVALKMLRSESLNDERNRERFRQEAKVISSLNHPNIVSVFDFGFSADNSAFLVMDFLDGKDLDALIEESGYMTPEEVVPVFKQICDAIGQLHKAGIIHRDLKPGNIIIIKTDDGPVVKLVDFGMIKLLDSQNARQAQVLTQPGEVFGSPYYMSPEQCTGLKLDPRTDIYSMGILMYESVSGRPTFLGQNMAEMAQMHLYEKPAPIGPLIQDSEFPDWLQNIIFKALEKNVNDRYQSADELKAALISFEEHWHEKNTGESKPVSLRLTTSSRHEKDLITAAARAASQKQAAESSKAPKTVDVSPEAAEAGAGKSRLSGLMIPGFAVLVLVVLLIAVFSMRQEQDGSASGAKSWQSLDEEGQRALDSGNLNEAESDFNQAMLLAEKSGAEHESAVLNSMLGLAEVYKRRQKYETSERIYNQALQRIEEIRGHDSVEVAPVLLKLGKLYCEMGRLEDAETIHRRALQIVEKAFGPDEERTIDYLKGYAETKRLRGQHGESKAMQERAENILRAKNGDAGKKL